MSEPQARTVFHRVRQLPLWQPLGVRNFRLLWLGESVSLLGFVRLRRPAGRCALWTDHIPVPTKKRLGSGASDICVIIYGRVRV
jgi:hypothetical protein